MNAIDSLKYFIPEGVLLAGAFSALLMDLFIKNKRVIGIFSLVVLAITGALTSVPESAQPLFFGFFHLDGLTHFFRIVALGIVGITILASFAYKPLGGNYLGEYYSLFLFMAFGLILMVASTNLLMIFLSVEFVSILSYLLVGFLKKNPESKEAAIKYLLFGSLASAIMLYGMSLLYGMTGSLELNMIGIMAARPEFYLVTFIAMTFVLAGLGFKISMAPFHMWAPDVYQAAPTPVTAFLTVGPKALGFALLIRFLTLAFAALNWKWSILIMGLSILTMSLGNLIAVSQTNIKRLLAYSSIAQAGYILMGIAVLETAGFDAVLIYLAAYAFTNLGAFIVVIMASNHFGNDDIQSYSGLARRSPFLAASLTIFLLSLAGIPPLAGFIGKFLVFSGAIDAGMINLAIVAALNSAVAAYYYIRVVRVMYLDPAESTDRIPKSVSLMIALILMLIGTFAVGLIPGPLMEAVSSIHI